MRYNIEQVWTGSAKRLKDCLLHTQETGVRGKVDAMHLDLSSFRCEQFMTSNKPSIPANVCVWHMTAQYCAQTCYRFSQADSTS